MRTLLAEDVRTETKEGGEGRYFSREVSTNDLCVDAPREGCVRRLGNVKIQENRKFILVSW
jgi:hypothetical protein